jgi:hypothetical protein
MMFGSMFRRTRLWFASWRITRGASRAVAELDYRIYRLQREKKRSDRELEKVKEDFSKSSDRLTRAVSQASGLNKRLEIMLDTTKEELENLREIVVPGLVAANKTLTDARDAQSAMYAMKVAAMRVPDESQESM